MREPTVRGKVIAEVPLPHFRFAFGLAGFLVALGIGCEGTRPRETAAITASEPAAVPRARTTITVTSEPAHGMVVVNRQPIGLAPQAVEIESTPAGFFREPISIGVRFVSKDVGDASITEVTDFSVLDRVPARLEFKRYTEARRVFQE